MSEWMKFYYATPRPERFVDEARSMLASCTAQNAGAVATFLGRVMAANPSRIGEWTGRLSDLEGEAADTLCLAAWFSGTREGLAFTRGQARFANVADEPLDLFAMEMTEGWQLDALWSWYCATGEVRAVERIVSVLQFMGCYGAAAGYAQSAKTPEDLLRAQRDALFQAANWSLQSMMREHAPLKVACEHLFDAPTIAPAARVALAMCLERVDPAHWRVKIDPETSRATVERFP